MTFPRRAPTRTHWLRRVAIPLALASVVVSACGSRATKSSSTSQGANVTNPAAAGAATTGPGNATTSPSSGSSGSSGSGGKAIYTIDTEPTGLNYQNADDSSAQGSYLMQHVWPWAYLVDPSGNFVANTDLATRAEITSNDPQTVVYELNPKAIWSDGTPIGIDDFRFTWVAQNGAAAKNADGTDKKDDKGNPVPLYAPAATNGYEDVKSVESADGGKSVTVVFNKPYADWKAMFGPLLPYKAFKAEGNGDEVAGFNTGFKKDKINLANVVSGGRYKLSEYHVGQSATLVRNDKYWGEPGKLEQIVVPFIADSQTPDALANGEADVIAPQAQLDLVQKIRGEPNVNATVGFGTFWEHIDFNQQNPILADVNVRRRSPRRSTATTSSPKSSSPSTTRHRCSTTGCTSPAQRATSTTAPTTTSVTSPERSSCSKRPAGSSTRAASTPRTARSCRCGSSGTRSPTSAARRRRS